jgi:hypothetical protein
MAMTGVNSRTELKETVGFVLRAAELAAQTKAPALRMPYRRPGDFGPKNRPPTSPRAHHSGDWCYEDDRAGWRPS